jgi:hypothetical protein
MRFVEAGAAGATIGAIGAFSPAGASAGAGAGSGGAKPSCAVKMLFR